MGLINLFNKEGKCEVCGAALPKRQLAIFDTSHQNRIKDGQIVRVCCKCLMELLYKSLKNFKEPAVVIYPIKELNAYVAYNFNNLLDTKQMFHREENEIFIQDLKALLPPENAKCNCCENKATYTWCSSEIFNNDPFIWEVRHENNFEHIYLCKECLVRAFQNKVEDEHIVFQYVYPPISGEGFFTSWEV